MTAATARPCSWWDEERGVEVINSAALFDYFSNAIGLQDWNGLSKRHFPKFVRFIQQNYPQWSGIEMQLWSQWMTG